MGTVKRRTKQEVVSDFRCAELMQAARTVFARKGFDRATMDDIARAARVAKGTVYLYYRSKQDIYRAAVETGIAEMNAEARTQVRAVAGTRQKVEAFVATKLAYFERHRDFFSLYYREFGSAMVHPADQTSAFRQLYFDQMRTLEPIFREGVRLRVVKAMPAGTMAFLLVELTRAWITQRIFLPKREPVNLQADVSLLVDLFWKGISTP